MRSIAVVVVMLSAGVAAAQPIIDGTADPIYGPALSIQNTQTGFGNATLGLPNFANGSELDAAFGIISNGTLYLTLTGNLESNFNKLSIFLDTRTGGQNRLRGDNPNVSFNGLNRMGDDGSGNGLRFDAGFEADWWISVTGGNDPYQIFVDASELLTGGGGTNAGFLGAGAHLTNGTLSGGNNFLNALVTIDNSNTGGVGSGNGLGSGAGVLTGVELAIPLANLGNPTGPINIIAFVNGSGHDFLSNQVLGGIGGGGNLGEPRLVDFSQIAGDQFFTVIPTPGSGLLLATGVMAFFRRRRA